MAAVSVVNELVWSEKIQPSIIQKEEKKNMDILKTTHTDYWLQLLTV